jgi:nucleotide-binding universal stress UspA family protein
MQQGHRVNCLQWNQFTADGFPIQTQLAVPELRYRRILVPLSLNPAVSASLLLGFELASLHRSALTLLNVLPPAKRGLDAINLLHSAIDEFRRPSPGGRPCDAARPQVRSFVNDVVHEDLLNTVSWQVESRPGEFAETVVAEANKSASDLIILSATPFRWWFARALDIWAIRRRTQASVIVIRQQANSLAYQAPRRALRLESAS